MTEAEWLTCADPQTMLEFLRGKASNRKLRLFACGCCRRIWHLVTVDESRKAIEFAERYADGSATDAERGLVRAVALEASREYRASGQCDSAAEMAVDAACYALEADADFHTPPESDEFTAAWGAAFCAAESLFYRVQRLPRRAVWVRLRKQARQAERAVQVALLRDIFGNPFRLWPSLPPGFRAWNEATVVKLAQSIYDERAFDRLPVLADAIEEAGCTNADILSHCRQQG